MIVFPDAPYEVANVWAGTVCHATVYINLGLHAGRVDLPWYL